MKNRYSAIFLIAVCVFSNLNVYALTPREKLLNNYQYHCNNKSDIYEHIPVLRALSQECESVVEIGVHSINSTWGILLGLSENNQSNRSYLGIDVNLPPAENLNKAKSVAEGNGISFNFWHANDMTIKIPETDLLFIDSLHTYAHLTYELETFSHQAKKYIALHDTSGPWGRMDESWYVGDRSEYPSFIDRTKRGLWAAVVDFLDRHPEWTLLERRTNNNGFTVLKRLAE